MNYTIPAYHAALKFDGVDTGQPPVGDKRRETEIARNLRHGIRIANPAACRFT